MSTSQPPIKTLEEAVARIHQLERAAHLNVGPDGVAIPHPPEPRVRHILINAQVRDAEIRAGNGITVPVAAGYVYWHAEIPRSHVGVVGLHPRVPGAIIVEHPTLQEGETAPADELAAIVAAAKPAAP